jgi:type IV pilus assembly protein PilC
MSTYVFKAMDLAGVKAKGEVEADSKQAVSDQLRARGLIVLDIADKRGSREIELEFLKSVKASELAIFSRQLATMISSGMSILRALYVLEEQTESKFLKETIVAVRKDVEAGLSLSDAMARHPKVFNPLFVAMTQAGEAGGVLEDALLRVADQLEKDASLRRQIKSAMVYPTLVIVFAVGVMMALVAFLVPVFENVFKQFGGELPAITKVSVAMSHAVVGYWWLIFGGTAAVVVAFLKWKKSSWGRPHWDRFRLRVPMKIGAIVQQVAVARWPR